MLIVCWVHVLASSLCVCVCVFGLRNSFASRQSVSALSGEAGRSVWLCCAVWFSFYFFIFLFSIFPSQREQDGFFAAWLQPVMSLLPLAAVFAHAVLLWCDLFFMCVSLHSNTPAYFHVYILLWIACEVGFVCVCACLYFGVCSGLHCRRRFFSRRPLKAPVFHGM